MDTKKKILVVEDDKFISLAYKDGMTRAGFEVSMAMDGVEALEKMRAEKPDIVLLDLIMPTKGGFEVLEEMHNDAELKTIPVIILSNLGQDSDTQKCKELGAVDYIIKSNFKMQEAIEKVKSHLP